mmetsp:Transcript_35376/g.88251  ORF Transcript_35376/g.88251 Transcript_35376/m.88251 type:complete len:323 (+) Transcript_35376:309-1277(+)
MSRCCSLISPATSKISPPPPAPAAQNSPPPPCACSATASSCSTARTCACSSPACRRIACSLRAKKAKAMLELPSAAPSAKSARRRKASSACRASETSWSTSVLSPPTTSWSRQSSPERCVTRAESSRAPAPMRSSAPSVSAPCAARMPPLNSAVRPMSWSSCSRNCLCSAGSLAYGVSSVTTGPCGTAGASCTAGCPNIEAPPKPAAAGVGCAAGCPKSRPPPAGAPNRPPAEGAGVAAPNNPPGAGVAVPKSPPDTAGAGVVAPNSPGVAVGAPNSPPGVAAGAPKRPAAAGFTALAPPKSPPVDGAPKGLAVPTNIVSSG